MKLTTKQLKQIIKEELGSLVKEAMYVPPGVTDIRKTLNPRQRRAADELYQTDPIMGSELGGVDKDHMGPEKPEQILGTTGMRIPKETIRNTAIDYLSSGWDRERMPFKNWNIHALKPKVMNHVLDTHYPGFRERLANRWKGEPEHQKSQDNQLKWHGFPDGEEWFGKHRESIDQIVTEVIYDMFKLYNKEVLHDIFKSDSM